MTANQARPPAAVLRAAILLAAGASTRMGTPKALLPWAGTTLVAACVRELAAAGVSWIVVVAGAEVDAVRAAVPHVQVLHNPDVAAGRSRSLRIGAEALPPTCQSVLVQSVDQPCRAAVLARLFATLESDPTAEVALPVHQDRRGHPICLAGRLLSELCAVREEDQGLRAVVHRHAAAVCEVPVDTDQVLLNLNNPATYAAAHASWGQP
jgi:molybdenum cofactor cytidylyltransferase